MEERCKKTRRDIGRNLNVEVKNEGDASRIGVREGQYLLREPISRWWSERLYFCA